jgi:hypothetical protein
MPAGPERISEPGEFSQASGRLFAKNRLPESPKITVLCHVAYERHLHQLANLLQDRIVVRLFRDLFYELDMLELARLVDYEYRTREQS